MPPEQLMIDKVLAQQAAAGPPRFYGDTSGIDLSLDEIVVAGVYHAVSGFRRGWGKESDIARAKRLAAQAGIAQHEVDAAVARAEAETSADD